MAISNKDSLLASKLLVDFLRDFTLLTEKQLVAVRILMEQSVADIMQSVTRMNDVASQKKVKAIEVLVQDEVTNKFVSSSSVELEKNEEKVIQKGSDEIKRKSIFETKLMRAGGIFSKHMEAISSLDQELQDLIAKVVGVVSVDDVIGQRLSHVIDSMNLLQVELSSLLLNFKQNSSSEAIRLFRNKILNAVYQSYTSEEEKQLFHGVFGQPKESKRVG